MIRSSDATRTFLIVCAALSFIIFPSSHLSAAVVDDAQVQFDRGDALAKQGSYTLAIVEWRKLLTDYGQAGQPSPLLNMVKAEALVSIAESLRQLGDLDNSLASAASVLTDYSQFRSQCCEATLITGKICQAKGNTSEAVRCYGRLLRNYPEKLNRSTLARSRIEELLASANLSDADRSDIQTGIAAYDSAKQDEDAITAARRAAKAKADAGDAAGARADLIALAGNPSVANSHARLKLLGEMQLRLHAQADAQSTFNRLLALAANECDPEEYRRMRVEVLYEQGNFTAVVTEANAAAAIYTDGAVASEIWYYLGRAYDRQGDIGKCLEAYNTMASRYGASTDPEVRAMVSIALARMGSRLAGLGKTTEAVAIFQRIVTDYADTNMARSAANSLKKLQQEGSR